MTSAEQARDSTPAKDLFGHPRGLAFLFATEMWERFSYYGMRAPRSLHGEIPAATRSCRERDRARHAQRRLRVDARPARGSAALLAYLRLYTGLVYLTPVLGGILADRILGQHRTVLIGAVLMAFGHFDGVRIAVPHALATLIVGSGAFKPNIAAQVGGLYPAGDARRDRAYSIFYVGINLGAFLAPLVCGTLGFGWHYGFTAAGIGMTIGLVTYLCGMPSLPPDALDRTSAAMRARTPLDRKERQSVLALIMLFVPTTLFWATYEQSGNTISLWADDYTDRYINLIAWKGEIPVTWFQAVNPLLIFAFTRCCWRCGHARPSAAGSHRR